MQSNAVKLPVTASVLMECEFWPEADGWSGVCEHLSLLVHDSNFEETKKMMEAALQTFVNNLLAERGKLAA